ncbi:MLO-like protein 1 [Camellia lanceoleosa]|uniref:MLO-like protein 1 n=1 Tax=Camellia lanceoleosa TaxID=1840588 RepID=A0ACC0IKL9_9ERIC|nr:MLO-like protein 1 [Camellia lanceoleosa]
MGDGGKCGEGTTLKYTPTWVVASICTVIVSISLAIEHLPLEFNTVLQNLITHHLRITEVGQNSPHFPPWMGNTFLSQPTSYGKGRDGPIGGGKVMSRSALGGSFITRCRGRGGSAKATTQRETDKGKGKA